MHTQVCTSLVYPPSSPFLCFVMIMLCGEGSSWTWGVTIDLPLGSGTGWSCSGLQDESTCLIFRACASICVLLWFICKTQVVLVSSDLSMLPQGENSNKSLVSRYQGKPRSTKKPFIAYTWLLKCHTRLNAHKKKIKLVIQGQIQG